MACLLPLLAVLAPSQVKAQQVQQAFTNQLADLRAGPSHDYPLVTQLVAGVQLAVTGCTDAYYWCDVLLPDGLRGWVHAQGLSYSHQGQSLPLSQYGPSLGIPLLVFNVGSYWGSHYQSRPFYNEPRYWGGRPPSRYAQQPQAQYNMPLPPNSTIGQAPGIVSPTTGIVGGPPPGIIGPPPGVAGNRPPGIIGVPPPNLPSGYPVSPQGPRPYYGHPQSQPGLQQPQPANRPDFAPVGPPRRFQ